jgi:hypothetical protein
MDKEKKEPPSVSGWSAAASPAAVAALLADIAQWDQDQGASSDEDFEMLALVVEEAARGVDIPARLPAFWEKLMRNAELREAFLDCLELLEASRGGRLRPWPPAGHDGRQSDAATGR